MKTDPDREKSHGDGVSKPQGGGRGGGGESGGGPYKNPDMVEPGDKGHHHGGQTDIAYRGGGDAEDGDTNPNAVTDPD
jgi:hypothetical protein